MNKSFIPPEKKQKEAASKNVPYFDQLRASVNLVVASSLIALATSLTLPLSTTYVTFMVAMGTSLSDRAWGRESAVYRISGVITVIGGWFFTAFEAFTLAFIIALVISWGGIVAAVIAVGGAFAIIIKTYHFHKIRARRRAQYEEKENQKWDNDSILKNCELSIKKTLSDTARLYAEINNAVINEDRKKLRSSLKKIKELNLQAKELKADAYATVRKLQEDAIDSSHYYIQMLDYLREIAHCVNYIAEPAYEHLDNHHPPLTDAQIVDVRKLTEKVTELLLAIRQLMDRKEFERISVVIDEQQHILAYLKELKKKQVKLIQAEQVGTRNSLLYFNMLAETKNLLLFTVNMLKAHRDFIRYKDIPIV